MRERSWEVEEEVEELKEDVQEEEQEEEQEPLYYSQHLSSPRGEHRWGTVGRRCPGCDNK